MTFAFYLVDEKTMPPESAAGSPSAAPEAIIAKIREEGGPWAEIRGNVDEFADAFITLDGFVEGEGLLPNLAFAGSPHLMLTGAPGRWRLGYFEASLAPSLDGAFRLLSDEIGAAFAEKSETTVDTLEAFTSALSEANQRGLAVAILHE